MHHAWKIFGAFAVVLGVVTGLVTVASADFRHAVRDAWNWAYPEPLLIGLALAVVGLSVALAKAQREHAAALATKQQEHASELADARDQRGAELAAAHRAADAALAERDEALAEAERDRTALAAAKSYADERERTHDERVFADVRTIITRDAIDFVEDQDFKGPWRPEDPQPFHAFIAHRKAAEWRFNDPELETLRQAFYDATLSWLLKLVEYSGPAGNMMRIRPPGYDQATPEDRDRWDSQGEEVNELSLDVAETYDALIEAGRARGFDILGD